jgi:hypothetical protein
MKQSSNRSKPFYINTQTYRKYEKLDDVPATELNKIEYWHSELELVVWNHLLYNFGRDSVERQVKILIHPETNDFPKLSWKIDFKVSLVGEPKYIEVKGKWILDDKLQAVKFTSLLRLVNYMYPNIFKNLIILDDSHEEWTIPGTFIKVVNYKLLRSLI